MAVESAMLAKVEDSAVLRVDCLPSTEVDRAEMRLNTSDCLAHWPMLSSRLMRVLSMRFSTAFDKVDKLRQRRRKIEDRD